MTTDLDIYELDAFRYESKKVENPRDACNKCQGIIAKERQETQKKQSELLQEIENLKQEFANMLHQKELLMRSSFSGSNADDNGGPNTSRSLSSPDPHHNIRSPKNSSSTKQEENKLDNIEQALQPLLEKINDPSEEIYFQDSKGRIFKITLCTDQEGADLEDIQQNMQSEENQDENLNYQEYLNTDYLKKTDEEEQLEELKQQVLQEQSPDIIDKKINFNQEKKNIDYSNRGSLNAFQTTAAHSSTSGMQYSNQKETQPPVNLQTETNEEYSYEDEVDDDEYDFRQFTQNNKDNFGIIDGKRQSEEEFNMLSDGDIDLQNDILNQI